MATLAAKLQLEEGALYVLNAPKGRVVDLAKELGDVAVVSKPSGSVSGALLFVNSLAEAKKLAPKLFDAVGATGLAWIAYPKGSAKLPTDLNRDRLWEALASTGWRPVRLVALDEVWSAMRFRPEAKVKPRAKKASKRSPRRAKSR